MLKSNHLVRFLQIIFFLGRFLTSILKIFIIFTNKSVLRMNFKIFWHQIIENDNETIIIINLSYKQY